MAKAYTRQDKLKFISNIYGDALKVSRQSGFPLEFILAQAAHETGWGEKVLPGTNNLFNIKADSSWDGPAKSFVASENIAVGGKNETINVESEFRVYDSFADSINDWLDFIRTNPRYHGIGENSDGVPYIDIFDREVKRSPELLAVGLWHDGYATDPDYVNKVIWLMRGPTMKEAIEKAKIDYERKMQNGRNGGMHSGETLERDASDYHVVWRVKEDGSTRGSFVST